MATTVRLGIQKLTDSVSKRLLVTRLMKGNPVNPIYSGIFSPSVLCTRGVKRYVVATMREMKRRRKEAGPEPLRHRSVWLNWNYPAELYAFGKRLNEDFTDATLRMAFSHQSYIDSEEKRRQDLRMPADEVHLSLRSNTGLMQTGMNILTTYIKGYLQHVFPLLPEEGISSIHDFLVSDDLLSFIASNLGMSDLILCADFPPEKSTLANTFKAIVGAIANDQNLEKAQLFIEDFVLTQLVGRDINEIWGIPNPTSMLRMLLKSIGKPDFEPRLLRHSSTNTIFAVFQVGLYCNKQLIGQGFGEMVSIAEEFAARDALKRLFGTTDDRLPLPFGKRGNHIRFDSKPNPTVREWQPIGTSNPSDAVV